MFPHFLKSWDKGKNFQSSSNHIKQQNLLVGVLWCAGGRGMEGLERKAVILHDSLG